MTQIKFRRDSAANFASSNPVLGTGEPAWETDTKKLKIGDGSTAYNDLDYFSSGGGTEFTVVQPLKLVDGTLTLQIDDQTIQVQDGKLVANLDELGNEVNTLAGEVTDLSGRVTACEADILTKENKITPTGALTLQEKIISNLANMNETETLVTPKENQSFTVDISKYSFSNGGNKAPQCYIAIPYQFGQWLKIPSGYRIQSAVFFGHFLSDGDFLITAAFTGRYYDTSTPIYGGIVRGKAPIKMSESGSSTYLNSYAQVSEKAMSYNIKFTDTDPCAYLQLIDNTTNNNIICGSYNYGYGPSGNGAQGYAETHVVYNSDLTNYSVQDFVADTTTALIMSPSTSEAILKSAVGLYAATDRLAWSQAGYDQLKANLGDNLFDLTASQVSNYLELNTDSSLTVNSDGQLGLASTIPTKTSDLTNDSGFITSIPTASADTLGGVKVGDGLSITEDGILSASGGGSGSGDVTAAGDNTFTGTNTFTNPVTAPNISLENEFTTSKINYNISSSQTMLRIYNTNNAPFQIGHRHSSNTSFIQPCSGDTDLAINNYGDQTATDGIATNVKIYGNVQDGAGNTFLTSGNVTAYVTETYVNGTSGYRLYSDKYIEQWGSSNLLQSDASQTITMLKTMANIDYRVLIDRFQSNNYTPQAINRTTTTFLIQNNGTGTSNSILYWTVLGYIA